MDTNCINTRKLAVIGCGYVGSATAFALMQSGICSELVLLDVNQERAEGEASDISHGIPFNRPMKIYAGDYADIADAAIVIITAGAGQAPGESRLDLAQKNLRIFDSIILRITAQDFRGILLIVSNPVDVLTLATLRLSGYPGNRVIGSGTVLDTARLKTALARHLQVDSRSVHAFIVGEHGDSEVAAWSSANVSGIPMDDFCELRGHYDHARATERIARDVRESAYEIISQKGASYYGIAMSVRRICECILRDEKSILPISTLLQGEYGIYDIALSLPCIVGKDGCETRIPVPLNDEEIAALRRSADTLRRAIPEPALSF